MNKVIKFDETGSPEVLRYEDVAIKHPTDGEVLIAVEAIGINRAEAMFRSGTYLEDPYLPTGLGYECAGVVEEVGHGVNAFIKGDLVSVIPSFSMNNYATYCEHAIVPAYSLVKRPNWLDSIKSAAVWMPYLTAYGALIELGAMKEGQTLLVPAASSSVGLAAIQIANSVGAIPIATTRTSDKINKLKHAGAAYVILTNESNIANEVMKLTNGRGADLIFDPVAGPHVIDLVDAIAVGGTLFIFGNLSGNPTPFPVILGMQKSLTMRSYTIRKDVISYPNRFSRGKEFIINGLENNTLNPIIARIFNFDEMIAAHKYMESNQQFGKIIVKVV